MARPCGRAAARRAAAWAGLRRARVRARQFGEESIALLVRPHVRLLIRSRAHARLGPRQRGTPATDERQPAAQGLLGRARFAHFLQNGGTWEGYAAAIQAFDIAFQRAARHEVLGLPGALAGQQASGDGNGGSGDGNGGTTGGSDA
jgi:hypothetical protein